ncbi:hypothetical protein H0H87_000392 [Tephrocybe sp. NHM501043]|nr:hypothetical protein H0H87_000392 [Tephrocybe sp. NHM501043]
MSKFSREKLLKLKLSFKTDTGRTSHNKDFIKKLLHPNPAKRPTVAEAFKDPWLTSFTAGELDISEGLRDHFDPRARWKSAIASARALNRLGSLASRASTSTSNSGGWMDSDDEEYEAVSVPSTTSDLGENDNSLVTPPATEDRETHKTRTLSNTLSIPGLGPVDEAHPPLHERPPTPIVDPTPAKEEETPQVHHQPKSTVKQDDEDSEYEPVMPGSFDLSGTPQQHHGNGETWGEMFRKLRLTQ